jgi:thiamine pyrophosphate-dependent acetolactate synthase large subunit-like protein
MKGADIAAKILKAEGTRYLIGFPHSELFDAAAALQIRPIITRTERVAVNIAEGYARMTDGGEPAVVTVQYGPGVENAFGGIAQAFSDRAPVLFLPTGYERGMQAVTPNFEATRNFRHVTKWCETALRADQLQQLLQHAFWRLRNGGPAPVLLELPVDLLEQTVDEVDFDGHSPRRARPQADLAEVRELVDALLAAKNPVIMAGQGILLGQAWRELLEFAELLQIPVMTTPNGKSAFPENHPLSLGTAGKSRPATVDHFLEKADLVFGIGTSLTRSLYITPIPKGKTILQVTIDEADLGKDYPLACGVIGDARSVLRQIIEELRRRPGIVDRSNGDQVVHEVGAVRRAFMEQWLPHLQADEAPMSPYRVVWELMQAVDPARTVVTHDAGHPRDQVLPFYQAVVPHGYLGWGKTTQLGTGLGLMIGAKLARPDWLAVAVMGEAAFGMVGMDFETAVRCELPILAVVLRNGIMGGYGRHMPVATERYQANRLSGDYVTIARGLGGYAESAASPTELRPALQRCIEQVESGRAALLEVITHEEGRLPGLG